MSQIDTPAPPISDNNLIPSHDQQAIKEEATIFKTETNDVNGISLVLEGIKQEESEEGVNQENKSDNNDEFE